MKRHSSKYIGTNALEMQRNATEESSASSIDLSGGTGLINRLKTPLHQLQVRIGDLRAMIIGNARGRALDVLHQSIKIIAGR